MFKNDVGESNETSVKTFILLGLSNVLELKIVYSFIFLVMYTSTLTINVLLIVVVRSNEKLRTPMYFLLCNLSLIDICFSSTVVPKILANTLSEDKSISFLGCATQLYCHVTLGAMECLLLAVMSLDRYTAICKPLHYNSIMNKGFCVHLTIACWVLSFLGSIILTEFTFRLSYCRSNHINHYFCEMPQILQLSCQDIWLSELVEYILVIILGLGSLLFIITSYVFITLAILKISTTNQRQKAFSTCASHLVIVFLFFGAILFMHLRPPSSYSPNQDKVLALIYTVVAPVLNPIIYSIRNKDIKDCIKKIRFARFY
ncbi:hypothetical protein GDO81_021994 [Engystomops pustulosus]|uniref:Olfactory receptor n=1 Tax=Engystomops pustulosus TaxID=76066 RepID=A0AAV6Z549_ENGPU|nr:hypothetical protein GDO81_021994 [Engystomops pustulosus]